MKSALKLVAFAQGDRDVGIVALLDVAMAALDEAGSYFAAAYVELARTAHAQYREEQRLRDFRDLGRFE